MSGDDMSDEEEVPGDEEEVSDLAGDGAADWQFGLDGGHVSLDFEEDDEPRRKKARPKGSKNADWDGNPIQDLDGKMSVGDVRKVLMGQDGYNWKRKCGGGNGGQIRYVATCASCPGGCEKEVSCVKTSENGRVVWRLQSNGHQHSASGGDLLTYTGKGIGGEFEAEVKRRVELGEPPMRIRRALQELCGNDVKKLGRLPSKEKINSYKLAHRKRGTDVKTQLDLINWAEKKLVRNAEELAKVEGDDDLIVLGTFTTDVVVEDADGKEAEMQTMAIVMASRALLWKIMSCVVALGEIAL